MTHTNRTALKEMKKLSFLIGKWHTEGKILSGVRESKKSILGFDTYEWIAGDHFILHTVAVFMGNKSTEVTEIIGYDRKKKKYFLQSYDNSGEMTTMYASLGKPGVLKLGDKKMRAVLRKGGRGIMTAEWELFDKKWQLWMQIKLSK